MRFSANKELETANGNIVTELALSGNTAATHQ
jgi:hypothetical protein